MISRKYQLVIGRNEPVIFQDYDKHTQIPAKVDSGAYRSAIHCENIKIIQEDGEEYLTGILLKGHPCAGTEGYEFKTRKFDKAVVASSFGHKEERYEIKVRIKIGPLVFITPVTLADRSKKLFPILLGRRTIRKRFLVDVTRSNIDRIKLKNTLGINIPDDEEDWIDE
ncbi:MAG: RimK/LysX family protein [Patescibacteria group bacterium]|jgi:hypothetical protein|nr:RimK/LysX family protein [Patescibacteria group bacterium]